MNRVRNISLGLMVLVGILASSHHSSKLANSEKSPVSQDMTTVSKRDIASETKKTHPAHLNFEQRFQLEAEKVGKIDSSGKDLNQELSQWVSQLSNNDLQFLMLKSLDVKENGDERGLAIFALAKSQSLESLSLLRQVALTSIPENKNPKIFELEQAIRAIAVEGLLNSPHRSTAEDILIEVANKSADRFVADRSKRALHYIKNGGKTPEQQDLVALEALLKSSL